jgi:hypothetical protein
MLVLSGRGCELPSCCGHDLGRFWWILPLSASPGLGVVVLQLWGVLAAEHFHLVMSALHCYITCIDSWSRRELRQPDAFFNQSINQSMLHL